MSPEPHETLFLSEPYVPVRSRNCCKSVLISCWSTFKRFLRSKTAVRLSSDSCSVNVSDKASKRTYRRIRATRKKQKKDVTRGVEILEKQTKKWNFRRKDTGGKTKSQKSAKKFCSKWECILSFQPVFVHRPSWFANNEWAKSREAWKKIEQVLSASWIQYLSSAVHKLDCPISGRLYDLSPNFSGTDLRKIGLKIYWSLLGHVKWWSIWALRRFKAVLLCFIPNRKLARRAVLFA